MLWLSRSLRSLPSHLCHDLVNRLAAPGEVLLGDHPDHISVRVHHREAGDRAEVDLHRKACLQELTHMAQVCVPRYLQTPHSARTLERPCQF